MPIAKHGLSDAQALVARQYILDPTIWRARIRRRPSWFTERLDGLLLNGGNESSLQLPAFPSATNIGVFSDYGGLHKDSPVETYSFFIVDFGALGPYGERMKEIRRTFSLNAREISFKERRSGAVANALPAVMRAADLVPGLLVTLVVEKTFGSIMGGGDAPTEMLSQLEQHGYNSWSTPKAVEDLGRKLHCVSYWLSMLGREGMGTLWMTDNDNIVANADAERNLSSVLGGALTLFGAPAFRIIGTAKEFIKEKEDEQPLLHEALSIADLMAGAVAAYFTERRGPAFCGKYCESIAEILTLCSHQGVFLKKLTVVVQRGEDGKEEVGVLTVDGTKCSKDGYLAFEINEALGGR